MLTECESGVKPTLNADAGVVPVMCYKMTALVFRL